VPFAVSRGEKVSFAETLSVPCRSAELALDDGFKRGSRHMLTPLFAKVGIFPIREDFARMAVYNICTRVSLLEGLVAEGSRVFFRKSGDVLAGSLAIGTSATAPTVTVNPSNKGDIGEQANVAVVIDFNVSLCIGHSGKFFDSHCMYLSIFYFVPLEQLYNTTY